MILLDAMLGHLLSWLRILGHDTIYLTSEEDDKKLLREAMESGRVLVTRDSRLHERALRHGVKSIYLPFTDTVEALTHLAKELGLRVSFDEDNTRCPECNTQLIKTSTQPKRWRCPGCGKEYWIGGHWRNISRVLREVENRVGEIKHGAGGKDC